MRRIRAHVRPVDATERVAVVDALTLLQMRASTPRSRF